MRSISSRSVVLAALILVIVVPAVRSSETGFWPTGGGSATGYDIGNAVATAPSGDVLTVGEFEREATFGDTVLRSEGLSDIFVIRQNGAGGILWAVSAGGAMDDRAVAVTTDESGNAYVTGVCAGTVRFGGITAVGHSDGQPEAFVAKIDPEGSWRWVILGTGPEIDEAAGIGYLPGDDTTIPHTPGSVIIGGRYRCDVTFGSKNISQGYCPSNRDSSFVVRIDTDGNVIWLDGSTRGDNRLVDLDVAPDGTVYVAGMTAGDTGIGVVDLVGGRYNNWLVNPTFPGQEWAHRMWWSGNDAWINQDVQGDSGWTSRLVTWSEIDLAGATQPILRFIHGRDAQGNSPTFDGVLSISVDGGGYQDIVAAGGVFLSGAYDGHITDPSHPFDGQDVWVLPPSPGVTEWVEIDLSAFVGSRIDFDWSAGAAADSSGFWAIDHVSVVDEATGRRIMYTDMQDHVRGFVAALTNAATDTPSWQWVHETSLNFDVMALDAASGFPVVSGVGVPQGDTLGAPDLEFWPAGNLPPEDGVVAKLRSAGDQWDWAESLEGAVVWDVATDGSGVAYATAGFDMTRTYGSETLTSTGLHDFLIASFDDAGNWRWATGGDRYDETDGIPGHGGGPGEESPRGITVSGGAVLVTGAFEDTAVFGDDEEITSHGDSDVVTFNLSTEGRHFDVQVWTVGQPVPPPPGAELSSATAVPELKINGSPATLSDYFYWQGPIPGHPDAALYPIKAVGGAEILWRTSTDLTDPSRVVSVGVAVWPQDRCQPSTTTACYQVHVAGAPVDIRPDDNHLVHIGTVIPSDGGSDGAVSNNVFTADSPGWAVLEYVDGDAPDPTKYPVVFEVIRTFDFADAPDFSDKVKWPIGTEITEPFHDEPGKTGFVLNPLAFYDGAGGSAAYDRQGRTGQIIPVNRVNPNRTSDHDREMTVVWYRRNHNRVYWGERPIRYDCYWPLDPDVIIVASEEGGEVRGQQPLDPAVYPGARIYDQPDPTQPGFNPNDEHALTVPSNTGSGLDAIFALRADFGTPVNPSSTAASDPYVLIKYQDGAGWAYRVFQVLATSPDYPGFSFTGTAATRIQPPYPLSLFPGCAETSIEGQAANSTTVPAPFFKDVHDELWASAEGSGAVLYHYPLQAGFYYDLNGDDVPDESTGQCVPWMSRLPDSMGGTPGLNDPIRVEYQLSWPEDVPLLEAGESLFKPKRGLPDIYDQAAVEVVYDHRWNEAMAQGIQNPNFSLAQVINGFDIRSVSLSALPQGLSTEIDEVGETKILGSSDGAVRLPVTLRKRLRYDALNGLLKLGGIFDDSGAGEPLVILDVMSETERDLLYSLSSDEAWTTAVHELFLLSRNPQGIGMICIGFDIGTSQVCINPRPVFESDILIGWKDDNNDGILEPLRSVGGHPALTAGAASDEGFITLAFNNDESLGSLPVSLEVIRVGCLVYPEPPAAPEITAPYMGEVKVLPPDNVFDESLTLHFNGDFGGRVDEIEFEWYYHPDEDGTPPTPLPDPEHGQMNGWFAVPVDDPQGAADVTIGGADLQTLSDNWYVVRYRGLSACNNETQWSIWAGQPGSTPLDPRAQLAEGWVKRVLQGLNPFDARVKDFHKAATNTYASMIEQLGPRYEGDIALNPSAGNLNSIGLIEAYETVLHRARTLSIDGTPPVDYGPADTAILDVTSKIADFYLLLGNEAFADTEDPTVGISTDEVQFNIGSLAPTIFNFENQVADLLEEELVLLRGRDDSQGPVAAPPVYNRFFWNFTGGNGEVAYALSYDIKDKNLDGFLDATDAKIQFPQGHGDTWGHDLTAITHYYDLLRHPFYSWVPRPEAVLVAGVPIQVDYFDERKFAKIAAARALAGAELVNLTYRSAFTADPDGQWQGYKDDQSERAWGLDGWGRRAGQAALFDWVTGNAILPAEDTNPDHHGISKIDRTTVDELDEVIAHYETIQAEVDAADRGLNPLGLAQNALAFDIDPARVDAGESHFEQIYDRAAGALDAAVSVWDFANELNRMLRFNQDQIQDMAVNSHSTETDFRNKLIEIFGYPFSDDIGPAGTYPDGYDGPDLYHYMYVDVAKLSGTGFDIDGNLPGFVERFTATYGPMPSGVQFLNLTEDEPEGVEEACDESATNDGCTLGDLPDFEMNVEYVTWRDPKGRFAFIKPPEWTGERRAQGKIQDALNEIFNARIALEKALADYNALRGDVSDQINLIKATYNLRQDQIEVANDDLDTIKDLNATISALKLASWAAEQSAKLIDTSFEASEECIPDNEIAGMADGGDLFSALKCAVEEVGNASSFALESVAGGLEQAAGIFELAKEQTELQGAIYTRIDDSRLELYGLKDKLDGLLRREPVLGAEVFARAQQLEQARQGYLKALAEGQRLLSRLITFRKNTAVAVQEYRYEDMAFRIFRNDALQKYRAAFDMAARYTYLAATAYDYDTSLLGSDGKSGQRFLTDIVRQQSLGQILDGEPVPGTPGLADPMGKMKLNFAVLEGQMGINNPEIETDALSLRSELLRLTDGADGAAAWRKALDDYRVDDLWQVPEFRAMMRPFAPESEGPQPGLVIPFPATVTFGLNVFGKELGPHDHAFDPSRFATRIRGTGVFFDGYENLPLAATPRVYLVPAGDDYLRVPTTDTDAFPVRQWKVVDQIIPIPYPVNTDDLAQQDWTPLDDMLDGSFGISRRFSAFRAYPDTGAVDDSQLDSRLVSRSVWNSRWLLVIPGGTLLGDADEGLETFIHGVVDADGNRDEQGVDDVKILFKTYAYEGLK